jgi:tetratricopeptide (TPR) repeat protein
MDFYPRTFPLTKEEPPMFPNWTHLWLLLILALMTGPVQAQGTKPGDLRTAKHAYEAGHAYMKLSQPGNARVAWETALTLKPDDALKGKIYRSLLPLYRIDADYIPYMTTMEYVISHPTSPAEKYLSQSNLQSFLRTRGKQGEAAQYYEAVLRDRPKDATALYILSGLYSRVLQDPRRAVELLEKLMELTRDANGNPDHRTAVQLAEQYVQAGKFKEGAILFEKVAPLDKRTAPHHLREAATAWLKAGEKEKALAVAKRAVAGPPEDRSKQLAYFWHQRLGVVFLETGAYQLAIDHLQQAIDLTEIDGYRKDCQKKLEQAKQKLTE